MDRSYRCHGSSGNAGDESDNNWEGIYITIMVAWASSSLQGRISRTRLSMVVKVYSLRLEKGRSQLEPGAGVLVPASRSSPTAEATGTMDYRAMPKRYFQTGSPTTGGHTQVSVSVLSRSQSLTSCLCFNTSYTPPFVYAYSK